MRPIEIDDYPSVPPGGRQLTIRAIAEIVALDFEVPLRLVFSDIRTREAVQPRHVGMYLAHVRLAKSLSEIARGFGGKDHTTVLNAVRRVSGRAAHDAAFAGRIARIAAAIEAHAAEPEPPPAPEASPETWRALTEAVADFLSAQSRVVGARYTRGEASARQDARRALKGLQRAFDRHVSQRHVSQRSAA